MDTRVMQIALISVEYKRGRSCLSLLHFRAFGRFDKAFVRLYVDYID